MSCATLICTESPHSKVHQIDQGYFKKIFGLIKMRDWNSFSLLQLFATLAVATGGLLSGIFFAFPSVAVPLLQRPAGEGGWGITLEEGSWIGTSKYPRH